MSTGARALGVDVGGTSIKAGVVEGSRILAEWRVPTPSGDLTGAGTVAAIAAIAARARADHGDLPVGVAVPGVVDEDSGRVVSAVNTGWTDLPMRDLLVAALGSPVSFAHDVRAGGLAEARSGAAAGATGAVLFVPVGTGIAAALIIGGTPVVSGGWAGEIGQIVLTEDPFAGLRVEEVASARAVATRLGVPDARHAADLVRAGDAAAQAVWNDAVDVLATALAWSCAVASPEVIVLGGGLAESGPLLLDPVTAAVTRRIGWLRPPRIVPAVHGDRAAVLGAAYGALQEATA